jgi:hypothetical protein
VTAIPPPNRSTGPFITLFRRTPWWKVGISLLLCFFLTALLFPVFAEAKISDHRYSSASVLRMLGTAMHIYAAENNDHLAPAAGWQGAVLPYTKNPRYFIARDEEKNLTDRANAYNLKVSSVDLQRIKDSGTTPLFFVSSLTDSNPSGGSGDAYFEKNGYTRMAMADTRIEMIHRDHILDYQWELTLLPAGQYEMNTP